MVTKTYPSWRYHKTHGSKIVHSHEEHLEHEKDGWVESPAHFDSARESKSEEKTDDGELDTKKPVKHKTK